MARSILVLCIVLLALAQMNFALLGNSVGTQIQGQVSEVVKTTADTVKNFADGAASKVTGIADDFKLTEALQLVGTLKDKLSPLVQQVTQTATGTVLASVDTVQNALNGLTQAVGEVVTGLNQLLGSLLDVVKDLLGAVGSILNLVGDILSGLIQNLQDILGGAVTQITQITTTLVSSLDGTIKTALTTVNGALDEILGFLDDSVLAKIGELPESVLSLLPAVYSLVGNIQNLISKAVTGVLTKVGQLLGQMKILLERLWVILFQH